MNHLLSIPSARAVLGISRATLFRLVAEGAIPVVRIGRRTLFDPREIEAFVRRNSTSGRRAQVVR